MVQRSSSRFRRRFPVTVGTARVFTRDIGEGGFSAEIMRVQSPGTELVGTIRINGVDVRFAGTIAWARSGVPHLSLRGRIGVRFARVPAGLHELLDPAARVGQR